MYERKLYNYIVYTCLGSSRRYFRLYKDKTSYDTGFLAEPSENVSCLNTTCMSLHDPSRPEYWKRSRNQCSQRRSLANGVLLCAYPENMSATLTQPQPLLPTAKTLSSFGLMLPPVSSELHPEEKIEDQRKGGRPSSMSQLS